MNYIKYDPQTGDIISYGYTHEAFIRAEIDAGEPTILIYNIGDPADWHVNLQTKQLEPRIIVAPGNYTLSGFISMFA